MKKMLTKALAVFLLVSLVAGGNGMNVLAQGIAQEVNTSTETQETIEEDGSAYEEDESEEGQDTSLKEEKEAEEESASVSEEVAEEESDSTSEGTEEESASVSEEVAEEESDSASEGSEEESDSASEESEEVSSEGILTDVPKEGEDIMENPAVDEATPELVASGDWGESVHWSLDNAGVLTVTQDKDTPYEYFTGYAPWREYSGDVTKLVWGANCLKDVGNGQIKSAISFGAVRYDSSLGDYVNEYPKLKEIEFTENVSMEYITDMSQMFYGCSNLVTLDLSRFQTKNVTNMSQMFDQCSRLTTLDVSGFVTENVITMSGMFYGCENITELDITSWDTENVQYMYQMFYKCGSLTTLDLSGIDTSKVTNMSKMFFRCESLTTLDLSGIDTSKVTDMSEMFFECESLTTLDLSGIDTSKVTDMYQMFYGCGSLTTLDLSGIDISKVTDMSEMFYGCENLTALDLNGINAANVTDMSFMFQGCRSLTELDLSGIDKVNVTDMSYMLYGCKGLTKINLGEMNTANVTDMSSMFEGCHSLTELDLSGADMTGVTNMRYMFEECHSLTTLDLNGIKTANVTDVYAMFKGCHRLTALDLSGMNTDNVTSMSYMFADCQSLTEVDLSNFETGNLQDMAHMFAGCKNLKSLDLSSFDCSKVNWSSDMLNDCEMLERIETPRNLTQMATVVLPVSTFWSDWYTADGELVGRYLPIGASESITLTRALFEEDIVPLTGLSFEKKQISAYKGMKFLLIPIMKPKKANDTRLLWQSSNPKVATVDATGEVMVGEISGEALITVSSVSDPKVYATCKVIVGDEASAFSLRLDCPHTLSGYVVFKNDVVEPKITWTDGEPWEKVVYDIRGDAIEYKKGKLYVKKAGSGTITATAMNKGIKGPVYSFDYVAYEEAGGVILDTNKVVFDAYDDTKREVLLTADVIFRNNSHGNVTFSISGSNNLQLTDNGDNTATIKCLDNRYGSAVVTATSVDDAQKTATCTVTVGDMVQGINIKSTLLKDAWGYVLLNGESANLKAEIVPKSAGAQKVRWESTYPDTVAVDQNGKITALKNGSAQIYAYATDGSGVYEMCNIHVRNATDKIVLWTKEPNGARSRDNILALYEPDEEYYLSIDYEVYDKAGRNGYEDVDSNLDWSISGSGKKNAYMASQKIYMNKPGTVTVTAKATDGSKKKESIKIKCEQRVYDIDVNTPKNVYSHNVYKEGVWRECWEMPVPTKKTTIIPQILYNEGKSAPDKKWRKYEIILSDEAAAVMQKNKKGDGIVIPANTPAGDYEITFRTADDKRECKKTVVIRISDEIFEAGIVFPSNVKEMYEEQMLAEGIKLKLSTKVNGMQKNPAYQYEWKLESEEGNQGIATISDKGELDLRNAKSGDIYHAGFDILSNGEVVHTALQKIVVTKRITDEDIKFIVGKGMEDEVMPSVIDTSYAMYTTPGKIKVSPESAALFEVKGGKKGVLLFESYATEYFQMVTEGVGKAKIDFKALDGSDFKTSITIEVVKPEESVAEIIVPKEPIYASKFGEFYIYYKMLTQNGGEPADCRIKWKISDMNKVYWDNSTSDTKITDSASGYIKLYGSSTCLGDVTLTGTTMDGSNQKCKIKIKVTRDMPSPANPFFRVCPAGKVPYYGSTPLLIHGKTMKMDVQCNYIYYSNKRLGYKMTGTDAAGNEISQEELKELGVVLQNGVIKTSSKSTYTGKVTVEVAYFEQGDIESSESCSCTVQILPPVSKVIIQNVAGESITKANVTAGESLALSAILTDKNALSDTVCQDVVWTVSDKKNASVNIDGVVTISPNAKKNKKIKVTATAQDGSKKKATVTITVK